MYGGFWFELEICLVVLSILLFQDFYTCFKKLRFKTQYNIYQYTCIQTHVTCFPPSHLIYSYFIFHIHKICHFKVQFAILKFRGFSQGCTTTQFQNISMIPKRNPKPIRSDYLCPLPFPSHWQPLNLFHLCAVVSSDIARAWSHLTCLSRLPPFTEHRVCQLYLCGCMCLCGCVPGYGWTTSCLFINSWTFGLLQTALLWPFMYKYLYEHISVLLGEC